MFICIYCMNCFVFALDMTIHTHDLSVTIITTFIIPSNNYINQT